MKKLMMFLIGLLLLALTGLAVFVAGAVFDAGTNQRIVPYFFQPLIGTAARCATNP